MSESTPSPSRRKSTGKRLRFSVFHRDHFTCQYCGTQPPDVVLVVDHIVAVAHGGETAIDNLVTACEACNQGKADRSLANRPIRPDADLLYLETQQEIAELRRFQQATAEREDLLRDIQEQLKDLWQDYAETDWAPTDSILRSLLERYNPEVVRDAIVDVATKVGTGYLRTYNKRWVGYLYVVARNLAAGDVGDDE